MTRFYKKEFEITKGYKSESIYRKRTDNTIVNAPFPLLEKIQCTTCIYLCPHWIWRLLIARDESNMKLILEWDVNGFLAYGRAVLTPL
jgi:hypothetical protein